MYDVIVVGGRCAGASLAMLLARQGARILLVDRATFPSDIPHGHFIHRHGPGRLKRWGLLDPIAAQTPEVKSLIADFGDFPLRAEGIVEDGVAMGYGPRRTTLDKILLDAALAAGVEVRQNFSVTSFVFDRGAMAGIRGRPGAGPEVEERATLVVGADGRRSGLARTVQAEVYNAVPTILGYYFSYWSGVQSEDFEIYVRQEERRVVFCFKTEHRLLAIFMGFPIEELHEFRRDIDTAFMGSLDRIPDFGERVRAGVREEKYYGAADLPNFYRKPYGPGWALVGDAGLHKDPYLALGICDSLRDVELLAGAIQDGLGGKRPMDQALADYERYRNEASNADYRENIALARFAPPPPQFFALRAAVKDKPAEATQLFKARSGMIDPREFFNPENIDRLLGGRTGP